jgi:hypothetical protein
MRVRELDRRHDVLRLDADVRVPVEHVIPALVCEDDVAPLGISRFPHVAILASVACSDNALLRTCP